MTKCSELDSFLFAIKHFPFTYWYSATDVPLDPMYSKYLFWDVAEGKKRHKALQEAPNGPIGASNYMQNLGNTS